MENSVGKRMKKIRKVKKLNVDDLAEIIGVNRATYYRYEKDEILKVPYLVIESIADALGTTPAYLMGREPAENKFKKHKVEPSSPIINNSIADKIKSLRASRQLTAAEMANELHIDAFEYMQYENGEKDVPFAFVQKLADYFGISLNDFDNLVDVHFSNNTSAFVTTNSRELELHKRWMDSVGDIAWTDEEYQKLIDFALFVKSQRKDDK